MNLGGFYIRKLYPFLFTIAAVLLVTLVKVLVREWTGIFSPLLLYYTAILASAWYGGRMQGLLALALSLITTAFLFVHNQTEMNLRFVLFAFDSSIVIALCGVLQNAKRRAEKALEREKRAHQNQIESDLRFRRVFESQMIGLMFTKSDGSILSCNNYILDLLGYTRSEFEQGRVNWRAITPPEFAERSEAAVEELRRTGHTFPFEKEYIRKDGTRVPILLGAGRLEEEIWVAFILDMTLSKKAQIALDNSHAQLEKRVAARTRELSETAKNLQQSQKFLDSVIENIPNMVFVKDAQNLRFLRFNKAGEDLLGYDRDALIGKNDFDFFPNEEAESFQAKDRSVLEKRVVVDIAEESLSTRFGLRFLHTKKIPILDTEGKPAYLLGISEDITDKKAAEQQRLRLAKEQAARCEAEKSARQLRFLSEASANLNESLDLKSMLNGFTKTVIEHMADWCEIILIEEAELKVQDVVIAHRDPAMVEYANHVRQAQSVDWGQPDGVGLVIRTCKPRLYANITPESLEQMIRDPARRKVIQELGIKSAIIVPLQSYGRVIGVLSISSSDSGRIYNDLDMSVVMDLAKRASFSIENSRLFSKAQEASQAKSAFLANMSHEIRTPLGAMLGFAELLNEEIVQPEHKAYLDTLLKNGQQLLRIVDEILDLSKVESDCIHLENVEFSLPELIDEVMTLLRLQATEKNLGFYVNSIAELPNKISTDPVRLRQVLINVVGNAIKFTNEGDIDVHLEVHTRAGHPNRPILEISVSDTGIGIASEQRDKLFQPFVQADNSMTRRFGGTGLGLFLSRRMTRMMGGDVVLGSSQVGHGSQFIITIAIETLEPNPFLSPRLEVLPPPRGEGGDVLIVDDAADNRALMELYVSRMGFHTETVATGREAVDKALNHRYEVILMDVQMPEMDGFEAVHELRARHYHGPIVALTAHTMKGDRERCLEGGFDDYLGKPIDRDLLKKSLSKFVSQSSH